MTTLYTLFKFIHVVAAMVWLGGLVAVGVLNARIAREGNSAVMAALVRQSDAFGKSFIGPSMGVALVAGIVMMIVARLGFPFWIIWGIVAMVASGAIGGGAIRGTAARLGAVMATAARDDQQVVALQRRIALLNSLNILVLLSAVWMMVFRPTL